MAIVKNTKNKFLSFVFFLVVAGLYNLILFLVVKGEKTQEFWVCYGFIMGAMCLFGLSVHAAFFREKRKGPFGLPFIFVAGIYLVIEFILGHILMAVELKKNLDIVPVLIPQVVLFILYLLFMIPTLMGLNYIKDREAVVKKKVFYLRDLKTELDVAAACVTGDPSLKKSLELLSEDVFCSDPMTSSELSRIEDKIKTYIYDIRDTAEGGNFAALPDMIQKVKVLLKERNEKCKVLK